MRLRPCIAAILLLAAGSPAIAAQGPETAAAEPFAEAIVELHVNDQPEALSLVVRRDVDGTLLIRAEDLKVLRLKTPARGAMQVNGERYYRLGPEIGAIVAFDEASMAARVTLPAKSFLSTQRAISAADAPRATRTGPGAFLNYDVSAEQASDRQQGGGFFELGLFGNQGVVTNTMVARYEEATRSVARLDTTWSRDFPELMATLRVGDSISTPGPWGRAVRFGGIQFGTNFSTQPMLVTTPLLAAEGEAVVPSTVDVFVNGRPIASEQVPPGPFSIDRLPVLTGAGQLQVVVTDALGRQQVLTQPYYSGTSLLRHDLAEYSVELGSVREDYGSRSFSYGDMIGVASYRRGMTDTLTAGARAEAQANGIYALGADAAWQAGYAGIVTAQLAAGGDSSGAGFLAGFGVERSGQTFSAFAQTQYASRSFVQTGMAELLFTPRQRTFAGFGFDLGQYGNAQLAYGLQSYYDADTAETIGVNYSVALGRLGYLGLYASQTLSNGGETNLLLTWSLSLGDRRTLSASVQQSSVAPELGGGLEADVTLQRDLPAGSGPGLPHVAVERRPAGRLSRLPGPRGHGLGRLREPQRPVRRACRRNRCAGVHGCGRDALPAAQPELRGRAGCRLRRTHGFRRQPAGGPHGRAGSRAGRSTAPVRKQRDQRGPDAGADGRQPGAVRDRGDTGLSQRSTGALPGRTRHGCDDSRRAGGRHACPGGRNGARR